MTAEFELWQEWYTTVEELKGQFADLHLKRHVWSRYRGFLVTSWEEGDPAAMFHDWASANYADSMTIGIRRNLDKNPRAVSLSGLMAAMEKSAHLWAGVAAAHPASARTLSPFPPEFVRASKLLAAITSKNLSEEASTLRSQVEEILIHADKRVAHTDSDKRKYPLPQWERLNEALDAMTVVFLRYYGILRNGTCVFVSPSTPMQWEAILPGMVKKSG